MKYEPLKKHKKVDKSSPKIVSTVNNSRTFYTKNEHLNKGSQRNHKSFLARDHNLMPSITNTSTNKKYTKKSKVSMPTKKKTHTKGNNSVYMKDFEKLMKERSYMDNKSLKRMSVKKAGETVEYDSKVKIYAAPSVKKGLKKSKKTLGNIEKQMYHKRVKSDQIYSVKLLMRGENKVNKNLKNKLLNGSKQPSATRPATQK